MNITPGSFGSLGMDEKTQNACENTYKLITAIRAWDFLKTYNAPPFTPYITNPQPMMSMKIYEIIMKSYEKNDVVPVQYIMSLMKQIAIVGWEQFVSDFTMQSPAV